MAKIAILFFLLCSAIGSLAIPSPLELTLKCLSWNVNGAQKLASYTPELGYLEEFDVILLQETFTTNQEHGLDLPGYIPYHVLGRLTGGRPSCGLTTLLKIGSFVGGTMRAIPSPLDWLQVTS
jgi:hypothetical protein